MKTITFNQHHLRFDRRVPPVLTVRPGEEVAFETLDACFGEVRSVEQFHRYRSRPGDRGGGPLAGPAAVEGARPGDTLVVEIIGAEIDARGGFQLIGPNRGLVADEVADWTCLTVRPTERGFALSNGIELPARPVVGTFGNAPAGEPTFLANPLGGNCDVPAVRAGCKLYIPIEVPGALFSLGDVHACQGDGEIAGAPEVCARVTVRFSLRPGRMSPWFMIEDADCWHSACSAPDEQRAARLAVFQNAAFIAENHRVELKDALVLLTMIGKLSVSRTGKWGGQGPVVCASFSKEEVKSALANYGKSVTKH